MAGTFSEESQTQNGVHWRQLVSLVHDPFVKRGPGHRMERCLELDLGLVGSVSFNLREGRGLVLYFARAAADVDRLRSPANERYMMCSTDLIGAAYAVRKPRAESAALRRALLVGASHKARRQLRRQKRKTSFQSFILNPEDMAKLKLQREEEQGQSVEDNRGRRAARFATHIGYLGKQAIKRVNNSRKKWRGAKLHGPPRQSIPDCCFVLVGVFLTMLTMLHIAGALGEADSRFGFNGKRCPPPCALRFPVPDSPVPSPPAQRPGTPAPSASSTRSPPHLSGSPARSSRRTCGTCSWGWRSGGSPAAPRARRSGGRRSRCRWG